MKYLRYGCLSISKNIAFTFIMVLEIVALLVTTNITIASANSRQVLYRPFEDILNKEGYYCSFEPIWETTEDYYKFFGLFDKLKSASVYNFNESNKSCFVDDRIFFKYNMPLKSGSWPKTATDEQGRPYVVISPDYMKNVGDIIDITYVGECVVSGVLTNVTYLPNFSMNSENITSFYRNADYDLVIDSIKNGSSAAFSNSDSMAIMSSSAYEKATQKKLTGLSCFITYNDDISNKDIEYNKKIIEEIKNFTPESGFVLLQPNFKDISELNEYTNTYLSETYFSMLPIILVVAAIVLIGLIGSVAINTVTQIKNYGIYFLCGSKWSDCFKISLANISIILLFSGLLSGILLYCSKFINLNYLIGQVYDWNNLYISLGIIVVMMLLSLIIPFGIIRFTSPVEVIKAKK